MSKSVVLTSKKCKHKQRRVVNTTPMEKIQSKKKVAFKLTNDKYAIASEIKATEECRKMFRKEIMILGKEVLKFKETCEKEMARYKMNMELQKAEKMHEQQADKGDQITEILKSQKVKETVSTEQYSVVETWSEKLVSLQTDMDNLAKKQIQIDREYMLADEEDKILDRKSELEKYEKEIEEIESALDRRQERCQKRQNDLLSLEEELDKMKIDLESKKGLLDSLGVDTSEANKRTKSNMEHIRNNLLEKQSFLQKKLNEYRTDLATMKTSSTAKDITIRKLEDQVQELQHELQNKETKIEQLNTQLSFVLEDAKLKENKKRLSRENSHQTIISQQSSFRRQGSLKKQQSSETEEKDKISNLPERKGSKRSVKHPMRQSVDYSGNGFHMIKSSSPDSSRACIVM